MTRDEAKKLLGEGATEEQVTNLLNSIHNMEQKKNDEIASLKEQNSKYTDYDELKRQLDEINKSKLSEQEKIELMRKEAQENFAKSKIILNTTRAKEILAGIDLDDEILSTLVSDDEVKTITNATKLKEKFDSIRENTIKQTKEDLMSKDLQPSMSNVNQSDDVMTFAKFSKMSAEEQEKFITEHPQEFENL